MPKKFHLVPSARLLFAMVLVGITSTAFGQGSTFTYQGQLTDGTAPANSTYDLQFKLFDALSGGNQIGLTLTFDGGTGNPPAVQVTNGIFAVQLDFGASAFPGANRFLQIGVKRLADSSYTPLSPRYQLTSAPYALKSLTATNADTAANSNQLGGLAAGQYVVTTDPRMTDARIPTAGSANYIQNTTPQGTTNFNISGNGTASGTLSAGTVNAVNHFSIAGLRVLSVNGPFDDGATVFASNTFAGDGAGLSTTPDPAPDGGSGKLNAFFGSRAGRANTVGFANSFVGSGSGERNLDGIANSFFGRSAGFGNTAGSNNSFFGVNAGVNNTTGGNNSYFGVNTATNSVAGNNNSFFGVSAGFPGPNNSGNDNTLMGFSTQVAADSSNQTAIGSRAAVTQSNSLVLGSVNGFNGATTGTNVGIGTTAPAAKLEILDEGNKGLRVNTATAGGTVASFGEKGRFEVDGHNIAGGRLQIDEAGTVNINRSGPLTNDFKIAVNGQIAATSIQAFNFMLPSVSTFSGIRLFQLNGVGSQTICRDLTTLDLATCSSSIRYKKNINPFNSGLSLINRLRPVSFNWKQDGRADMGLIAEEVADVEQLLVTHNDKGEIEGVKYDRVGVVLINAVKELQVQLANQQTQIEKQQKLVEIQQQQIEALKKLVCAANREAGICKN